MSKKSICLLVGASILLLMFTSCATAGGGGVRGAAGGIAASAANAALGAAFDNTMNDILGYAMANVDATIAVAGLDASARERLLAVASVAALESATVALDDAVEEARNAAMDAATGIAAQAAIGAVGGFLGRGAGGAASGALEAAQSAARSAAEDVFAAAQASAAATARDAALNAVDVALGGTGIAVTIPGIPAAPGPAAAFVVPPHIPGVPSPPAVVAPQSNLDVAIWNAAVELSTGMRSGARVVVLAKSTDSVRMSDFLIDEKILALGVGGFSVVDRSQLDALAGQLNLNTAEPVSSMMAQMVGRHLDVQYVVTGTFEPLAGFFRFRTQVTEVETAAIRGVHTANVQRDTLVAYLMGTGVPVAVPVIPAPVAVAPVAPRPPVTPMPTVMAHNQFTTGQRVGTAFLNIVPGLGSFVIMGDTFGGVVQVICSVVGWGWLMYLATTYHRYREGIWRFRHGGESIHPAAIASGALILAHPVFNIVRSATFGRNVHMAYMPENLNIALIPVADRGGIRGFSLFSTMRF